MSGRGKGRGRGGRHTPSGARLMLQRSAKEAGLDDGNLRTLQDITRPQLFPDYEWHSSGHIGHRPESPSSNHSLTIKASSSAAAKKSASTVYLINKSREIHQRFQNSPFYVRPCLEADVVRYGKQTRQFPLEDANVHILEHMDETADPKYVPPELLKVSYKQQSSSHDLGEIGSGQKRTLVDLAAIETAERKNQRTGEEGVGAGFGRAANAAILEDDDGHFSDFQEPDEAEEEDIDYTTNYYASEDESLGIDSPGGDEAVF